MSTAPGSERDLAQAIDHALMDLLRFDPVQSTRVGHHAHDGTFADHSAAGRRARRRALSGHAHALELRHALDADLELDRRLLLDELRVVLRTDEDWVPARRNPALYTEEVLHGIDLLLMRPPLPARLGALLGRLREAERVFSQARAELSPEEVPRVFAETAIAQARAGLTLLGEGVPAQVHAAVGDTPLAAAVSAAAGEAALALSAYANYLEERVLPVCAGDFAAGDSYFAFLLHHKHGIRQTPDELLHFGRREAERLKAALAEGAARLRPGAGSWQECLRQLDREGALAPGASVLEACLELCAAARAALGHGQGALCPIPAEEELEIVETPAYARPTVPFAAYWPPAPLGPEAAEVLKGVFWVTPPGPSAPLPARDDLLLTCVHEAYPGHHLQRCHAARAPSAVRQVIGTPVFYEGWALYCEALLPELGLATDASALYALRGRLWRALRVSLDVELHCRGLGLDEAARRLTEEAGLSPEQALAEVRRYAQTPTWPLSYLVGYHAFCHLRREAEARPGFSLSRFHAEVLRHGSVPLGYLHERMT